MEIKDCLRCGRQWTYRGDGRPIRCGQCKSPYWDRERIKEAVDVNGRGAGVIEAGAVVGGGDGDAVPVLRRSKGKKKHLHPVREVRGELGAGGLPDSGSTVEECRRKRHELYRADNGWWCSTCKRTVCEGVK